MVLKHLSMFTKPGSTPKFTLCRARFAKYVGYAASARIRGEGQTKIREPLLELVFPSPAAKRSKVSASGSKSSLW